MAVTALILLASAGVAGAALAAPELARPKTAVRVKACSLEDQTAVFYARMRKVRGTKRMRMRFTLLERAAGLRTYKRVLVPGLSRWHKSAEGVRSYGYSQEVRGLHAGSTYRMRVRYRWYGAGHKLLKSARRTSRPCRMFVPLSNLRARIVDVRSGDTWLYTARVTNTGQATADNVPVRFSVDGGVVDTQYIGHLDPGDAWHHTFNGPACEKRYAFVVDPDNAVPETNESDNRASASC